MGAGAIAGGKQQRQPATCKSVLQQCSFLLYLVFVTLFTFLKLHPPPSQLTAFLTCGGTLLYVT